METKNDQELPHYKHIERNEFFHRKHIKQKVEDIPICNCRYDIDDQESGCGERCLNVITYTECTAGYCPCGSNCNNQRFQKCQYAKSKLIRTGGRGWGLIADEDIKAGQFVIEYCGEVITWTEARQRSHIYEQEGMKDAYIISLDASELVDATRKGSHARFINHSCDPNCETRKWTVLGEVRVGIFAKKEIAAGTELSYDYNFEWFGGAKVRCLCSAACCSGFLGAKSRGFQEDTYLWEDDDDRYSIENIPLYDSEEDHPSLKLIKAVSHPNNYDYFGENINSDFMRIDNDLNYTFLCEPLAIISEPPLLSMPTEEEVFSGKLDQEVHKDIDIDTNTKLSESEQIASEENAMVLSVPNEPASTNNSAAPKAKRSSALHPGRKVKNAAQKQVNIKLATRHLPSKAQEEILANEEATLQAKSELDSLYDEIRPAIEEHEKDSQDSISTSVAEKWIGSCCSKLKADFDLHHSIIKNVSAFPRRMQQDKALPNAEGQENMLTQ